MESNDEEESSNGGGINAKVRSGVVASELPHVWLPAFANENVSAYLLSVKWLCPSS